MLRMSPDISAFLLPLLLHEGEKLLDIGSGDADLLKELSGNKMALYGIDPSYQETSFPVVPEDISLRSGIGESLPFEDGLFATVVLQCVFSLCQPEETVGEVNRVLRPGGRLILADLFTEGGNVQRFESPVLSRLYPRECLEACFTPRFQVMSFQDLTEVLRDMVIEAIWTGDESSCIPCTDIDVLRKSKARYGLWVFRKQTVPEDRRIP